MALVISFEATSSSDPGPNVNKPRITLRASMGRQPERRLNHEKITENGSQLISQRSVCPRMCLVVS
ncbi:hypothetical protein LZ30DRAFT_708229 [Colletotrichum cereale]|nr:hypothetical protein LZ30DRAFT_708229 [Colletotrichum cereale]